MLEKLKELALRYEDLQAQLADPSVYGDADRLRTVNRELKELAPVAETYQAYQKAEADSAAAEAMLSDPELRELADRLAGVFLGPVPAFRAGETVFLEPGEVLRFYTDGKGVSAQTAEGVYSVRLRLYELEERLAALRFARISHSEIINLKQVKALDLTFTGTIRITLADGTVCWASRRYVKKIKEVLGL